MLKVIIMAGGTGGHIYPGLACANEFKRQNIDVVWLGSAGGMEQALVAQESIPLRLLSIKGVRGKGLKGLLLAPWQIFRATAQALYIMRHEKPDVVLGMGGFVAGPGGLAAKLLNLPLVIHEQNAIAGTTNKLLSRLATLRLCAFKGALENSMVVGNPVRQDILSSQLRAYRSDTSTPIKLLVLGGSLGAQAINAIIPELVAHGLDRPMLDVWHQTGKRHYEAVIREYERFGASARIEPFIEDMAQAYAWADIVLCRSGAMTVSELAVVGLPSILVPFPHAIDDHQTYNAKILESCGAAYLVKQTDLSAKHIQDILISLTNKNKRLAVMGDNARKIACPDATQDVVKLCLGQIRHE